MLEDQTVIFQKDGLLICNDYHHIIDVLTQKTAYLTFFKCASQEVIASL